MTISRTTIPSWRVLWHTARGNIARAAFVDERDAHGTVRTRVLDVRDVEERKPKAKEIVVVEGEIEQQILRSLRSYKITLLYIAVMVTVMAIVYGLEVLGRS